MNIQIYSTLGQNQEISISETQISWELLKSKLKQIGVYIDGMQLLVGEKKLREKYLEQIPKEDFTLFVVPSKVKSDLGEKAWKSFAGSVKFIEDGLEYQKKIRNEWE
jgi:hypothetical protein